MTTIQIESVMQVLHTHLGKSTPHKDGERSFSCPFCNHYKQKLQVNIVSQKWHCWVCNARGQSINMLLRKSNAPTDAYPKIKEVYGERGSGPSSNYKTSRTLYSLPESYKPLYIKNNTPDYRNALYYAMKTRKLSAIDILKHQVGYCDSGPYAGMLIVPSYDDQGMLNYYVGRSFYDNSLKHKNPPISKDVIGFDSHINWSEPITIVEGAFDAIATKRNTIPLFGKKILPKLRTQILHHKVPRINLALDADAYKDSIVEIEYFLNNNIRVHYVELGSKDPNEMGYQNMIDAIGEAREITFFDLIQYKMTL
jgi:transcription elongation factor Elf1